MGDGQGNGMMFIDMQKESGRAWGGGSGSSWEQDGSWATGKISHFDMAYA